MEKTLLEQPTLQGKTIKNPKIVNLSSHILTQAECTLLTKGFKFTPTAKLDTIQTKANIQDFTRRLQLCEFFYDERITDQSIRKPASSFIPPKGRDKLFDCTINVLNNITITEHKHKSNLNSTEWLALKSLTSDEKLTIKEADKGGTIVIMDKLFYEQKIMDILADRTSYQTCDNRDPTTMNKIKRLIHEEGKNLNEKEKKFLTKFHIKSNLFYGLPKIHKSEIIKNAIKTQNTEIINIKECSDLNFRPIVAGPTGPTHRLSDFLDECFKPFIRNITSYLKDTLHFLEILPKTILTQSILCTSM